jgi:hypothetical protein
LQIFVGKRPGMGPIGISVRLCAAAFLMAAIGGALAQDGDKGRMEYMENCAGCHGADAKGAGPLSAKLKTKPTDLTLLAKRNHGNDRRKKCARHASRRRNADLGLPAPTSTGPSARGVEQESSQNSEKGRVGDEKARERTRLPSRSSLRLRGSGAGPHPLDRRLFGPAAGEVIRSTTRHKNGQAACPGVCEPDRGVVTALPQTSFNIRQQLIKVSSIARIEKPDEQPDGR